jgi:transketolase
VVDLYSVKPADTAGPLEAARATGGRIVVPEDQWPEGGIGSAVLDAFNAAGRPTRTSHLAVREMPGSGTPAELMDAAGISASHIAAAARQLR